MWTARPAVHRAARPPPPDAIPDLAARLSPSPASVVTSEEHKARDTGEALAHHLNVRVRSMPGLHEHLRHTVPWTSQEAFEASVHAVFY